MGIFTCAFLDGLNLGIHANHPLPTVVLTTSNRLVPNMAINHGKRENSSIELAK